MVQALQCSRCAASIQDDRWTNCPFCGALLAKPTIDPLKAVVAPERFAAVERDPRLPELLRHTPSAAGTILGLGCGTGFLVVWTCLAGGMALFLLRSFSGHGFPSVIALVPVLMCAVGVFMLLKTGAQTARLAGAPLERVVAVVRDERTSVSGGGEHSAARTQHHLLIELRSGERREYPCSDKVAGMTAPGDIGVAYLRGGMLLDFQRVEA